jgi:GAF domain-containing protein
MQLSRATPDDSAADPERNSYHNAVTASTLTSSDPRERFAAEADRILHLAAEVARSLVGAHQAAIAFIVDGNWTTARKYFSLSQKYAAWADYQTPALGVGIHALILTTNQPMRLTEAELEAHPAWQAFGTEAGKHPPMRGWLAVPLVGADGRNYGLLQLSDKAEGEFSARDEAVVTQLAELTALALDALAQLTA